MRIIEIGALSNGAHRNQTGDFLRIPEGWAVIPADMKTPNFPFGEIEVDEKDGVAIVTKWVPGILPEVEPVESPEPVNLAEQVQELKTENEILRSSITDLELALVELYENMEV